MRVRDEQLFYATRKGYQLWGALNGVELWVHPDDPEKYRIIPANPEIPPFVLEELLKLYDENGEEEDP